MIRSARSVDASCSPSRRLPPSLSEVGAEFRKCDYEAFRTGARQLAKKHFPHGTAIKMLLKPLGLSAAIGRVVVPTMTSVAGLLVR